MAQAYACRSELDLPAPSSPASNSFLRFLGVGQQRLAREICALQQPGRRLERQLDQVPPPPEQ